MNNLEKFDQWLAMNYSNPSTRKLYSHKIKMFFAHNEVLTQETLDAFLVSKADVWNANSYNTYRLAFIIYFKFIGEKLILPKIKKAQEKIRHYIHENELKEIIEKLPVIFNDFIKVQAVLLLGFYCALRPKEIITLKRQDIDLESKTIILRNTKTGRERIGLFPSSIKKALVKYFEIEPEDQNAFNLTYNMLQGYFTKINKMYNLKKVISPYTLRHSGAKWVLRKTHNNTNVLQRVLGHKNLLTTLRYAQITDQDAFDELRKCIK